MPFQPATPAQRFHGTFVAALAALFALRVAGQGLALAYQPAWLPAAPAWQGSLLPYPFLLAMQLALFAAGAHTMHRRAWKSNPALGRGLAAIAGVYGAAMAMRLLLGLGPLAALPWFSATLPAAFHLVLATALGVIAHYHLSSRGV
jgi:hypothetical protein